MPISLSSLLDLSKRYWRVLLSLALVAVVALETHSCDKRHSAAPATPTLPADAKEQVSIDNTRNQVTISTRKPDGTVSTQVVHGSRKEIVTVKKDGRVVVQESTFGGEFRPGIGVIGTNRGGSVAGTVDLFYYRRLDLLVGVAIDPRTGKDARGLLGIGYQPFNRFPNTSVAIGYSYGLTDASWFVGVRIRL